MSALFPRVKVWVADEDLTAADLNAEFNNILNNFSMDQMSSWSTTVNRLQATFDLGTIGNENLPQTLLEEIQGLRSMVQKITGEDQWYEPPAETLETLASIIGASSAQNRITSGHVDANGQPQFLQAPASGFLLKLEAAPTPFQYYVDNLPYEISADTTLNMAGAAGPSGAASQATFLDLPATGAKTTTLGELQGTVIYLGSVGASWSAREGKLSAFTFTNGANTEYFLGVYRVDDVGAVYISNCWRGFLFDTAGVNGRVQLASSEVISLLQLSYIFAKNDGTIFRNASNNDPVISGAEPSSPSVGDMWLDLTVNKWKQYDGVSFEDAECALIGISAQNSAGCVATRSFDFYKNYSADCGINLQALEVLSTDTDEVWNVMPSGQISVYGSPLVYPYSQMKWLLSTDFDSGVTPAINTDYYFYITNGFQLKISDVMPTDRQWDLKGKYHPSKPWRCVGSAKSTAASATRVFSFSISSYGGRSYVGIKAVGVQNLSPYFLSPETSSFYPNSVLEETFDLTDSGESTGVTLMSTGRPVLVCLDSPASSGAGIRLDVTVDGFLRIQSRPNTPGSSWSTAREYKYDAATLAGETIFLPMCLTTVLLNTVGSYSYRVQIARTGGAIRATGRLRVMEM